MTGPDDVAAALEGLAHTGRDPGCAVAVGREEVVAVDHTAGTVDGGRPWTSDTLVRRPGAARRAGGGAGGCSAWTEPALGYGAAFVSRGLGGHDRGEVVWEAVRSAYPAS